MNNQAFELLSSVSVTLEIPDSYPNSSNSIRWEGSGRSKYSLFDEGKYSFTPLSDEQLGLKTGISRIKLISINSFSERPEDDIIGEEIYESDKEFTVSEIMGLVLDFENKYRRYTEWFGGIDKHHIYFEGLSKVNNELSDPNIPTYEIDWGS